MGQLWRRVGVGWLILMALVAAVAVEDDSKLERLKRVAGIDKDGDGSLSQDEISESNFFRQADVDGDGTLGQGELRRYFAGVGGGDIFANEKDMENVIADAVNTMDSDSVTGIQVGDLARHWELLSSLITPEEVGEWIAYAVLLPQYREIFKENGVKGFDLPLFLEEPSHLQEMGIALRLHRQQILRSLSMRLLGLGQVPVKPEFSCAEFIPSHPHSMMDGFRVSFVWSKGKQINEDLPKAKQQRSIPVHKWRIIWLRDPIHNQWQEIGVYDHTKTSATEFIPGTNQVGLHTQTFKLEAWNIVGKGEPAIASCHPSAVNPVTVTTNNLFLPENHKQKENEKPPKTRNVSGMRSIFSHIDLDGDGAIEQDELEKIVSDLSKPIGDEDKSGYLLHEGIQDSMKHMDANKDQGIIPDELEKHWKGLQKLMTVERTVDWLMHAVELPQYADKFRERGITGFDFPGLIENGGKMLQELIGVTNIRDKALIERAITVLLFGLGEPPSSLVHVDVRDGDKCGSLRVDWTMAANALNKQHMMPIHKYRVLRRENKRKGTGEWEQVYDGLSTQFQDNGLSIGVHYVYRVEAWNLFGCGPPAETQGHLPNEKDCVKPLNSLLHIIWTLVSFPFYFTTMLLDNYYRITALLSVGGFLFMFSNMSLGDRKRMIQTVLQRVVPALKTTFGTSFGIDRFLKFVLNNIDLIPTRRGNHANPFAFPMRSGSGNDDDEDQYSPKSPHHELVDRALGAAFPTQYSRPRLNVNTNGNNNNNNNHTGKRMYQQQATHTPSPRTSRGFFSFLSGSSDGNNQNNNNSNGRSAPTPLGQMDQPSQLDDDSKWHVVRRHLLAKRVVNAWTSTVGDSIVSSDTDCSSIRSSDCASPDMKSSSFRKRMRLFGSKKKRKKEGSQSNLQRAQFVQAASLSRSGEALDEEELIEQERSGTFNRSAPHSIKQCNLCGKDVTKFSRHICGRCNLVYCEKHTAYASHLKILPCSVDSKCICVNCHVN